ncbi:hypothetical protein PFICI_12496 [Pestalotiopsis fici W106-1]|uniref:CFEM domain-containing protein n=1 Tax=Pestalotiopsis fici (strain W106-1 / CGMCC3.15140) TaxID=1229662 RepID=W3WQV7_PESFW|nr:uncharacterized protein PFICI_12496 [Pestalotiopsis fici W106-1]ETS75552.1 hypothetical protein PFICI_12496 [Pestalotiopsis fici W106-1]
MKFAASIIALAAVAVANMADMQQPPQCAMTCFMDNMSSSSCSNNMDYKCLCSDSKYISMMESCVQNACSRDEADTTKNWARDMCKEYGVDINMNMHMKNMKNMKSMRNMNNNQDMKNMKDMKNTENMENMKDMNM